MGMGPDKPQSCCRCECRLVAQSGHVTMSALCPLSTPKRTSSARPRLSRFNEYTSRSMGHLLSPPVSPSNPLMWADFQALCDLGGRVAGSAGEAAALAFARERLAAVPGAKGRDDPVDYPGGRCRMARLTGATTGVSFPCTPLLGTASAAGVAAEVLDLGLGRREDFERHADRIRGRIVMVRHEYPFASGHVHRRVKLSLAQQMGAIGVLIAHPAKGRGPP